MRPLLEKFGARGAAIAAAFCCALGSVPAAGQTAFGSSTTIVFPVAANTQTFTTTITLYNPNGSDITVGLDFFDANNLAVPGSKPCNDILVPANGSVAFTLQSQCTLDSTSHFGPLIATDKAGTNQFFGYSRVENNESHGFSIEGFPSENFATGTTNVTGLIGTTNPAPAHQTNCFVTSQADPITYDMKLFNGATGAQIGSTVSGSLNAFEQIRYLDVFSAGPNGVGAAAATDYSNVRAEFTRTSAGSQQMLAFCTVQDNATFGADFRIAKAVTPAASALVTVPWSGAMITLPSNTLLPIFVGPTASVSLAAVGTISAYGSGSFARAIGTQAISVGVCYENQAAPGLLIMIGLPIPVTVTTTLTSQSAAASVILGAGNYHVGLCAINPGLGPVNQNGNTSGFVIVTP